ncbi:MAG: AAA family ATPase [Planctomycetes bacterium]|nr:AAA family ATPase [Planctomycetota bacterium]
MFIKRISVSNFKSFGNLDLELDNFNVLIGANSSGKSNFVQIFKFLKDIATAGINDAISMQGGSEYVRNVNIGASNNLSLKATCSPLTFFLFPMQKEKAYPRLKIIEIRYEFAIKFTKRAFTITNDKLTLKLNYQKDRKLVDAGELIFTIERGMIKSYFTMPNIVANLKAEFSQFPVFFKAKTIPAQTLLLETPLLSSFFLFYNPFNAISIYDLDPKLSKKAIPLGTRPQLAEDGSNLAVVLKNILSDKAKKRKLANLLKELLPHINDIDVTKFAYKSIMFRIKELYAKNQYLPAFLLSDGTINITALIVALFFEEDLLTIIEEPEKSIHPLLMSKAVDMLKEVSNKKQIIVTTHNPGLVKYAGIENLLFVSRNKKGFSTVSRPSEKEDIKTFLKNDIGIDELYAQNLLRD